MERLELMAQVTECESCDLHAQCTAPVFMSMPKTGTAKIAILGEAPGAQEDEAGAPFIGPAGKMLRGHLKDAGIDPDMVAYVNTVSCFPHGTPEWDHVHACAKNREDQLAFSEAQFVLCVGKVAAKAIEPSLEMKHGRARPILKDGRMYFVTYHPAAALRNGNYEAAMADDIQTFAELVRAPDWRDFVRLTCSGCPKDMYWFDEHSLPWCLEHVPSAEFAKAQAVYERNKQAYLSAKSMRDAAGTAPDPKMIDADLPGLAVDHAPETSHTAASTVVTGPMRRKVYEAVLAANNGLTDDEIYNVTGLKPNSARPRRNELMEAGWVYDSGKERPGDSGAAQIVWMAKAGG